MKTDDEDDDLSPEDRALFRDSVKGTTPLGKNRPASSPLQKSIKKQKPSAQGRQAKPAPTVHHSLEELPLSDHSADPVSGETLLEYRGSGISHKDMRRLKNGAFPIDASLDLHGSTAEEARHTLLHFLDKARTQGWRCVRIVHGKGKHGTEAPILKNLVNTWLRQLPSIVAFCSAPGRDGGAGAVYLLLKA